MDWREIPMTALRVNLACVVLASGLAFGCDDTPTFDAGPPGVDAGGMTDAGPPDGGPPDGGPNFEPEGFIDTPGRSVTINQGETLDFTATCDDPEGGAVTHAWDFDGGATNSTMEDPGAVQFDVAGAFEVSYTCTDDAGQTSVPDTIMVAVNGDTMAAIDAPATDVLIAVGESVDFQGTCTDPEGSTRLSHLWDFMGAAPQSRSEDPGLVQFDTAGVYVVTYTCSDTDGGTGSAMITVTVNAPPEGVIDAPTGSLVNVAPGALVNFEATCTDADGDTPFTHAWDFGGLAAPSTAEDPGTVTFPSEGLYTITYTCTDAAGFADPTPATVTVLVGTPTRWIAITGDVFVDNVTQVALVDVTTTPPTTVDPHAGTWLALGNLASTLAVQQSEDGRFVAYVGDGTTDNSDDLYVVDTMAAVPTAVNLTSFTGGVDVEHFVMSPDGTKIAYTADVTTLNDDELYIVDYSAGLGAATTTRAHGPLVAGGDVYPTSFTTANDDIAWSADSTKVYFRGEVLTDTVIEAFVFDLTNPGAGAQRLHAAGVTNSDVDGLYAAGDDLVIFFADLLVDNATDVWAVDTSGAGPYTAVRVSPLPATTTNEAFISTLITSASSDGTRFMFHGDFGVDGANELYGIDLTAPLTTGMAVNLHSNFSTSSQDVTAAAWAPAGNRLIYRADPAVDSAEELFYVDWTGAFGTAPARVNTALTSPTQDIDNYRWAPDGSGVAFGGDLDTADDEELYYTPLPAGMPPGAMVKISPALTAGADIDDDALWITPTRLVLEADIPLDGQDALYVVDVTVPGVATLLHGPFSAASTAQDMFITDAGTTRDRRWVVARGDLLESSTAEAYLLDPFAPGTNVRLHASLIGTFQDVSYFVGEL